MSIPSSRDVHENRVVQCAMAAIKHIAERDHIPERLVKAMQFRVDTHYNIQSMQFVLRLNWRDPEGGSLVRGCQMVIDDNAVRYANSGIERDILHMVDNINLRGELFFMKLHKHFPDRIDKVICDRDGRVTVHFKNGRELSTSEQDLDSVEFLATCGMVYDL